MDSRHISPDVTVIGYGSLMSGLGMRPCGRMRVTGAARVALSNARRGFAKFSQHGDRFALVLEPVHADMPIVARTLAPDAPPGEAPEGISLRVRPNDLARICDREGYSSGALQRLRQDAAATGQDVAVFLWTLLERDHHSIPAFRARLFKLISYTSAHYIPHPVRLDDHRVAITFLAPGREGSGSPTVVPVRVRTGDPPLMTMAEAWRRKPNDTQLAYFAACLLGGMHGIGLRDLFDSLGSEEALAARLRATLDVEHQQELSRFLEMTGLDHATYWQHFGAPTHSLRRSGLQDFMKAVAANGAAAG